MHILRSRELRQPQCPVPLFPFLSVYPNFSFGFLFRLAWFQEQNINLVEIGIKKWEYWTIVDYASIAVVVVVKSTRVQAVKIAYRIDMQELDQYPAHELKMNDIAAVQFETANPLFFDPYERNRTTGSFILIDALSNPTVGAAMIRKEIAAESGDF